MSFKIIYKKEKKYFTYKTVGSSLDLKYSEKILVFSAPYLELPGDLPHSDFGLFYPRGKGLPKYFGWLTGSYINICFVHNVLNYFQQCKKNWA